MTTNSKAGPLTVVLNELKLGPKGNPVHQIPHPWRRHAGQGPVQTQGHGLLSLFAFSNEIFPPLAGNLRMSNIQAVNSPVAQTAEEFKSRGQAHKSLPC